MRLGESFATLDNMIHPKYWGGIKMSGKVLRNTVRIYYVENEGLYYEIKQIGKNNPWRVIDVEMAKEKLHKVFNDTRMRCHMASDVLGLNLSACSWFANDKEIAMTKTDLEYELDKRS